jgi:hypothetical protein
MDGLFTGAMICELLWQLVLEVSEGDKESPPSVIFAVRSSHWQQRTGMKDGQRRNWLWGLPVKYRRLRSWPNQIMISLVEWSGSLFKACRFCWGAGACRFCWGAGARRFCWGTGAWRFCWGAGAGRFCWGAGARRFCWGAGGCRFWSACCGWVLLWWPVNWDKAVFYLAKTCRWTGASGFGEEYEARASQRESTVHSGGKYMGLWWQ